MQQDNSDLYQREILRMHYLNAMGVEQYAPRSEIKDALPSTLLLLKNINRKDYSSNFHSNISTSKTSAENEIGSAGKRSKVIENKFLSDDLLSEADANRKQRPVKENTSPKKQVSQLLDQVSEGASKTTLQFSISVWQLDNGILVLDSRKARQAMPTTALLGNILAFYRLRTLKTEPEIIHWPPTKGFSLADDPDAVQQMITAFLESRSKAMDIKGLWLMGEQACQYVSENDSSYVDQLGDCYRMETLKCDAAILPSLIDMLIDPSLKRVTWKTLNNFFANGSD